MNCGVYLIRNNANRKVYVGSATNTERRINFHFDLLNTNRHWNKHLQGSFNEYGRENFSDKVLENCHKDRLVEREQYYLDFYKSYENKNGYNLCSKAYSTAGLIHNDDWNRKISLKMKGRNNFAGHHHKLESKKKISESLKGVPCSKEHNINTSLALTGRKLSIEHKENIRKGMLRHFSNLKEGQKE
jgi:group I intron endonuclease